MKFYVIVETLRKIVEKHNPIDEKQLEKIKILMSFMPQITEMSRQEKLLCEKINELHPEMKIAIPEIVDLKGAFGTTVLVKSIENHHHLLTNWLIEYKVDLNVQDMDTTPLSGAVYHSEKDLVHKLLENKADVNLKNFSGNTALALNLGNRYPDSEMHKLLIEEKADPNIQNYRKETALMLAIQAANLDIVDQLLKESKVNIEAQDENGNTALYHAIFKIRSRGCSHSRIQPNCLPFIATLLEHGAQINDPEAFFKDLKRFDKSSKKLIDCYHYFCDQLEKKGLTELLTKVQSYRSQLNEDLKRENINTLSSIFNKKIELSDEDQSEKCFLRKA